MAPSDQQRAAQRHQHRQHDPAEQAFDHVLFIAQLAAGKDLDLDAAVGLLGHLGGEALRGLMPTMGVGQNVTDADGGLGQQEQRVRHRVPQQVDDRHALLEPPGVAEVTRQRAVQPAREELPGAAVQVPPRGQRRRASAALRRTDDARRVAGQRPDQHRDDGGHGRW